MRKSMRNFLLTASAAAVLLFGLVNGARAHGPEGTLSERGYREMQQLAHELDEVAYHASDQAEHRQARIYSDRAFVRGVARFADHAQRFHERMDGYRTRPWQVDDELRNLLRDARDVQGRLRRAQYADEHTVADWERVIGLLNQMTRVYQADIARQSWEPWNGYGRRYAAPEPPPPDVSRYGGNLPDRARLGDLAAELEQRAERIYNAASAASGPFVNANPRNRDTIDALLRFRDQARIFRERLAQGGDLRLGAVHLAQDARDADARLQQSNLAGPVRGEWQEAMRIVDQIQAVAGN